MTDKKYIIALDQGTTSSRAVLLDHNANVVEIAQREFTQIYPRAGWVEHNPMEIWATQSSTLNEVVAKEALPLTKSRQLVLLTNVKPPSCGKKQPAHRFITRLCGNVVVLQILQTNLKRMVTKNISATPRG